MWEMVTIAPASMLCMEAYIEIVDNEVYFISRTNTDGCRFATYSLDSNTWSNVVLLNKSVYSKPAIIQSNGSIYMIYNSNHNIVNDWGNIPRSCICIQKINSDQTFSDVAIIRSESGIHYPCLNKYKGSLYLSITEDRRKLNISQVRSNISFLKLNL